MISPISVITEISKKLSKGQERRSAEKLESNGDSPQSLIAAVLRPATLV
jgi:hypothetical protein